ncbi:cytochrome c oxidase assembly protein [Tabrizicola oligotrophica]|uniref:Cytochrome c oxidase assembly protein CtaG n=1 Tax=Tabrizicola oligotrophica TaxID=2710650 RepID=A0A6M0QUS9_9RHOB|nr:cytochrome c oxidase assembly protein [Tabrizicola oligotrophica]
MTPQAKTGAWLAGIAATMLGLSFAAVPFYDLFCRMTGFAGTTSVSETASDTVLDQTVIVRFDASLEAGMPWEFKPQQAEMTLKIGETALAFYEAFNPTDRPIAGTASYNVAPDLAGGYFTKIECFCFTEQVLQPGERVVMPVSFYVDPSIVADAEAGKIAEITLSYTFHETPLPEQQAGLIAPTATAEN